MDCGLLEAQLRHRQCGTQPVDSSERSLQLAHADGSRPAPVANPHCIRDHHGPAAGALDMAEGGGDEKASVCSPVAFISYASQDEAVANAVVAALERQGLKCWIAPRDVVPGEFYAGAIVHAIDAAKLIVLVLSENAAISQHVLREVERASSKRRLVVAFRIDRAPLPADLEYFLNASHWLDASAVGVEQALPKLVDAVQHTMAGTAVATPGDIAAAARPAASPAPQGLNRPVLALSVLIALALGYLATDRLWFSTRAGSQRTVATVTPGTAVTPAVSDNSVAVLPFLDMSEKKDQEYFSDGLSEELIDSLTKVPNLRVPARTSSFYFKGKQVTVADIAKVLNVAHVLEGSVRKSGNRLRITAQLIRVDSGYHLWSETYDRELGDIFKVQDEIAAAVVRSLKISLLGNALQSPHTENMEAYALYLQARYYTDRSWALANERRAVDLLEQAVRLDPAFARAWAALAGRYTQEATNGTRPAPEGRDMAVRAAEKAVALGPDIPEAHMAKARISYYIDWDWASAGAEIDKARALDPYNSDALNGEALLADALGRYQEALELRQQAIALDPLSPAKYFALGRTYFKLGRPVDAEASFRKSLELNPAGPFLHWNIALALLLHGEHQQALAEMQREPSGFARPAGLAVVYHAMGREGESAAALRDMERVHVSPFWFAAVHAFRQEPDEAFAWLDRAFQAHDFYLIDMKGFPLLKNLEPDPRYKAFLRRMNLPE
jgi:TolB-like protein/Tfp pilus assembly protein PilF